MKKNKKQVFRRYDTIRIVNPEFFIRVGYPFDKKYAIKHLISEKEKAILSNLIDGRDPNEEVLLFDGGRQMSKTYIKMLDELAYFKLKTNGFGGPERKIFTKLIPRLVGRECRVMGKKVVKTGIRRYESDDDYYYGGGSSWYYLDNNKSHVILETSVYSTSDDDSEGDFQTFNGLLWIEEKNVEKVTS